MKAKSSRTALKWFVVETPRGINEKIYRRNGRWHMGGWGNGYVCIPRNHKFFKVDYETINKYIEIHGGLTFKCLGSELGWPECPLECKTEDWCIVGFDTGHFYSFEKMKTKNEVMEETKNLLKQLERLK